MRTFAGRIFALPFAAYVVRRLVITIFVLAAVSIIAFGATYILPGDPVTTRYPDLTREQAAEMRVEMGLDRPFFVQYVSYIKSVFSGEFGYSFNTMQPVINDIRAKLPTSIELSGYAIILATLLGVPLGIVSAVKRDRLADYLVRIFTVAISSTPAFWLGLISIYIFFYLLHWVPAPVGMLPPSVAPPPRVTGMITVDALIAGDFRTLGIALANLALPVVVFSLSITAPILRITRSAMGAALQEDYVTFARTVGLPERKVVLQDAFRGSQVALLTTLCDFAGFLFIGNALVETVFSWPGMGRYVVGAVINGDMAPVNTAILLVAGLIAIVNLLADLAYAIIDPRIRASYARPD